MQGVKIKTITSSKNEMLEELYTRLFTEHKPYKEGYLTARLKS